MSVAVALSISAPNKQCILLCNAQEGDRFLQTANACRFWPTGRGIFHNTSKTFLVWCGEEDHLRIISMQMGGHVGQVFARLKEGVEKIEAKIPFSSDRRLGTRVLNFVIDTVLNNFQSVYLALFSKEN